MPARLIRLQQTGHSHFITFTCYRRMQFLTQERSCSAAVQSLKSASARVA
jgi:REP element-mobilizing transposase RayT